MSGSLQLGPDRGSSRVVVCGTGQVNLDRVMDNLCTHLDLGGYAYDRLGPDQQLAAMPGLLQNAGVVVAFGGIRFDALMLSQAPLLKGIVSCVSGTEGIDVEAATAAGVLVAHAPTEANSRSMAEAAVLLILHLFYDLDATRDNARLRRQRPLMLSAQMLHGKTVGIIGWGRISATLSSLLAPFGVRLLVFSRRGCPDDLPEHAVAVPLSRLMSEANVVCLLAGVSSSDSPLVDRQSIALMKSSAFFVNLSRGSAVDEQALAQALLDRRLAGAALDVFTNEPLPASSPLWSCPNCIITPHQVGHTRESDGSLAPAAVANVLALLKHRVPPMVRNPAAVPRWNARWRGPLTPDENPAAIAESP